MAIDMREWERKRKKDSHLGKGEQITLENNDPSSAYYNPKQFRGSKKKVEHRRWNKYVVFAVVAIVLVLLVVGEAMRKQNAQYRKALDRPTSNETSTNLNNKP